MPMPSGPDALDAAWLRSALAVAGRQPLRIVKREVIGVGYGLDGTLARVGVEGGPGGAKTLVAKWSAAESGAREARFYREVAPKLGIALPKLLGAFADAGRALLLLEDVAPARQGDAIVGATPIEAAGVGEAAATFHAAHWAAGPKSPIAWMPRFGRNFAADVERTRE